MRLWSLHPQYLDPMGLVALWREALLAQAVLANQTKGYKHHPQLLRFKESPASCAQIASYLKVIYAEAVRRGYHFNAHKIGNHSTAQTLTVTQGQLAYEWAHLKAKLEQRAPLYFRTVQQIVMPDPHPLFHVVAGGVAEWEVTTSRRHRRNSSYAHVRPQLGAKL